MTPAISETRVTTARRGVEKIGTDGAWAYALSPVRSGAAVFVEIARGAETRANTVRRSWWRRVLGGRP